MATHTSNYGWTKPSGSDNVDISVLNDNLDDQDSTIHDAFLNMAPPFSESATYAVDDIVLYGTGLYKCHTAVVTPGSWTGSTNWQVYKLSEGGSGGGGGTTNYNQLTNKPQINSVELSGNKTASQLGLMASDGVVANPTGQTTGTLTALEVGGTKYAVPSGGTSDYTDLSNKPQVNGVELSGNKTASQLGMANSNTFQGTIAAWNALSTAEKKAYDHASIPDSIDGGVTFPANKVVMTGGGNVEDAIEANEIETDTHNFVLGQSYRMEHDAYVQIRSYDGNRMTVRICSASATDLTTGGILLDAQNSSSGKPQFQNMYVKKGMQIYVVNLGTNCFGSYQYIE